jgi:predicted porin
MNKKLIAVAIAAAVAAPAAMANDTTLYGKVHMSINNSDTAAGDQWNVSSHSSRLGVKGSEDLGNGMKAIFQYEMSYNGTDSATAIGSARNSYIGLAGDFGQVRVGRHDTPAKVAFYAAGNERLADSIIDLNGHFGFDELRTSNAIAYISPSFSGFSVAAAIVPGERAAAGTTTITLGIGAATTTITGVAVPAADSLADAYSLGLMYSGGGLKAGLGYTNGEDLTGLSDATLLNIGASYTMDAYSIGAQWQNVEVGVPGASIEKDSWVVTGTAGFGNNTLILMYGNSEAEASVAGVGSASVDADTFGVALNHKMSKRTSAYVAYRAGDSAANAVPQLWIGNGGTAGTDDAFGVGMIHTF